MKNKKTFIVGIIMLLLVGMSLIFMYRLEVRNAMKDRAHSYSNMKEYEPEETLQEVILLKQQLELSQPLVLYSETLEGIELVFDNHEGHANSELAVQINNCSTGVNVATWNINTNSMADDKPFELLCEKPVKVDREQKYEMVVKVLESGEELAGIYITLSDGQQMPIQTNDGTLYGDAVLQYSLISGYASDIKMVFALICFVTLFAMVIVLYGIWKKMTIEKLFVGMCLSLGIIYILIIPPYAAPDDTAHIATTYYYSNLLMGKAPVDDFERVIGMKGDPTISRSTFRPDKDSYIQYTKGYLGKGDDLKERKTYLRPPLEITPTGYIPQIVGVTIGRMLHMGGEQVLLLGSLCSLFVYTVLMYWVITIIPIGKMLMFFIGILPMSLQLATSFSYDTSVNTLSFLMIAYILQLAYVKDKTKLKDWVFLGVLTFCLSPIKVVYILIVGLCFMIPREKCEGKKIKGICCLGGIGVVSIMMTRLTQILQFANNADDLYWTSDLGYSVSYCVQNPIKIVGVFFRTFERELSTFIETAIGSKLGSLELIVPEIVVIGFLFICICSVLNEETEEILLSITDRCCMGVVSISVIFAVAAGLLLGWARRTSPVIEGIQGRYFLPIMPLIFLMLKNRVVTLKINIDYYLILGALALQVTAILSVFRFVVTR
ncbi:DUF2142 domain-containing protein [Lachnospiraceae bacterium LCP25S3_G4]